MELNVSVDILSTGRGQEGEQKDKSRLSLDYGEHYGVLKWWYIFFFFFFFHVQAKIAHISDPCDSSEKPCEVGKRILLLAPGYSHESMYGPLKR